MKTTFEIKPSQQLNVIDFVNPKPSSCLSNLVETPQTSSSPWTLRQQNRDKRSLYSTQNTDTPSHTIHKCNGKSLADTAQTHGGEGRKNSNINSFRHEPNGITLSEGAGGTYVEDTLTTPSEGAPLAIQFVDRNANKDLGRMPRNNRVSSNSKSKKPKATGNSSGKRSNKSIQITVKRKINSSTQRISPRYRRA